MNGACRQIQDLIVLHRPRNSNEDYSAPTWMPPHHNAAAATMNGRLANAAWPTSSDQRNDVPDLMSLSGDFFNKTLWLSAKTPTVLSEGHASIRVSSFKASGQPHHRVSRARFRL